MLRRELATYSGDPKYMYRLVCVTAKCAVKPGTAWHDEKDVALRKWNRRV